MSGSTESSSSARRLFRRIVGEASLIAGRLDLGRLSAVLADAHADRVAIRCNEAPAGFEPAEAWSFRAIERAVARLAAAHRALGVTSGARVVVATGNRIDVVLHVLALRRVGAVAVLANARWQRAELGAVVEGSRACAIVADADLPARIGAEPFEGATWRLTDAAAGADSLAAWLTAHPDDVVGPDTSPNAAGEVAVMLATSGTTGRPKLAALTSEGLLRGAGIFHLTPVGRPTGLRGGRDAVLAAVPLTHVMGLSTALCALCAGVPLLFEERFRAAQLLDRIERDRPNTFVGVPTMYADLEGAGAAERNLSSIQVWVSAADVMPEDRARRFQRYGAAALVAGVPIGTALFVDVYGMVELSGAAAVRIYAASPARSIELPAVAFALPGVEVRAIDPSGKPVRSGEVGQLQVRGRGVLRGYEGASVAALDEEGWFTTGDLARVGPGPMFVFAGRGRDRLKVGGFSVFPAEVEAALRHHPDVTDVAIVGVPDERTGERLVALVIPSRDPFDVDAFLTWAAGQVAGYRRPREAFVVGELPRGPHGKIDRAAATRVALERQPDPSKRSSEAP